jgi:hypothetical protein
MLLKKKNLEIASKRKPEEASNFWKGVLWAANVARMGYRWKVRNECRIRFWEDLWIGTSSLSILGVVLLD